MDRSILDYLNKIIYTPKHPGPGWHTMDEWSKIIGISKSQLIRKLHTLENLKKAKRVKLKQHHGFVTYFWIDNVSTKLTHESDTGIHTAGGNSRIRDRLQRRKVPGDSLGNKGKS